MRCPGCGKELSAVGGIPTVWCCNSCDHDNMLEKKSIVRYIGDTIADLKVIK